MRKNLTFLMLLSMGIFIGINALNGQGIFEQRQKEKMANDKLANALKAETKKKALRFNIESDCSGVKNVTETADVKLADDEILEIRLAGFPSAGFRWQLAPGFKGTLEVVVNKWGVSEMPGAKADYYYVLRGAAKGTTSLRFVYKRVWEDKAPIKECVVNVTSAGKYRGTFSYTEELPKTVESKVEESGNKALPSSFDWRSQGKVTFVKDQGSSGACWAFGTCASTESAILIATGSSRNLSEQYLCNCSSGSCQTGGWFAHWLFLDGNRGAVYESEVPFVGQDYACGSYNYHEKLDSWGWTDGIADTGAPQKSHYASTNTIKNAIYNIGPIAANCYSGCWANSSGIQNVNCTTGAHIVTIVGWNDASGGYWIIKNSWGTDWGDNGYLYLRFNTCDMGEYSVWCKAEGGSTNDTQAPSVPTGLTSSNITETSVKLSWNASTDNVGVTGYDVYRASLLLGTATGTSYTVTGLNPGYTYSFRVQAKDAAGNKSAQSTSLSVTTNTGTTDTQAPSVPTNLRVTSTTSSSISLSWTASTDNVGVSSYTIKNATDNKTYTSTNTSYTVSGLTSNKSYTFNVLAKDAAGNSSSWSSSVTGTTDGGTTGYCSSSGSNVNYEWIQTVKIGSYTKNSGSNSGYGNYTGTTVSVSNGVSVTLTPGFASGAYTEHWKIWIDLNKNQVFDSNEEVFSASGNSAVSGTLNIPSGSGTTRMRVSMKYNAAPTACETINYGEVEDYTVNIGGSVTDTQAPSVPSGLTSTGQTSSSISLSWNASTDNVGVTGYDIFSSGSKIGSSTGTTYTATGLQSNKNYRLTVKAKDAAGNVSAASSEITVATTGGTTTDTQPPSVPSGLTSTGQTSSSISLSWNASTDNVGVTGYDIFSSGSKIGSSSGTTYTATGLSANTNYNFTVKARDAAGNVSAASSSLTVATTSGGECTSPEYVAGTTYATGAIVQNNNKEYECKVGGWCSGAAWAYEPGTGLYWTSAWTQIGTCGSGNPLPGASLSEITIYPNPGSGDFVLFVNSDLTGKMIVKIIDLTGQSLDEKQFEKEGNIIEIPIETDLSSGVYNVQIIIGDQFSNEKLVVE